MGPHQKDGSILHMRQKTILLRLVEPVDFVDEQQRPLPVLPTDFRRFKDLFQIRHTSEYRTDLDEMQIGFPGQKAGDGGFSNTRRPPENQAGQAA